MWLLKNLPYHSAISNFKKSQPDNLWPALQEKVTQESYPPALLRLALGRV